MSSPVAELTAGLQAMLALKPPGVSGTRIATLTSLCSTNVQSESVLFQKLYTHFKKAPGTHKLGVLYVIDSVVRKWTELAKSRGQVIGTSAEDGTYGAAVNRVRELLPVLMNDIIASAPVGQKPKITKVVDIWEKGLIFPIDMLKSFREKLRSTTPEGSPPPEMRRMYAEAGTSVQPNVAGTQDTAAILAALATMARNNTTAAPPTSSFPAPAPAPAVNSTLQSMPLEQNAGAQGVAFLNPTYPTPASSQPVHMPLPEVNIHQSNSQGQPIIPPALLTPELERQIQILKTLSDSGVPQNQWSGILAALSHTPLMGHAAGNGATANHQAPHSWNTSESRDRNGHGFENPRWKDQGGSGSRSRSRSPFRPWQQESTNTHHRDGDFSDRGPENRNGGNRYRQRSPMRSVSPPTGFYDGRSGGKKWVQHDSAVPAGNIRVLSRTLFIGGVSVDEDELKNILSQFGKVQTCIVNPARRHAFVKMISRKDAVHTKEGMARKNQSESRFRSTRWGVGFGPRDCCDYTTGISIIPIKKLTESDRRFLLTAPYGGTGGLPIESGIVCEEPDIEIGQGVSSKALSRRIEKVGEPGLASSREDGGYHSRRSSDAQGDRGRSATPNFSLANMTPVAGRPHAGLPFPSHGAGAGLPPMPLMGNGMPIFPPGFAFPGQQHVTSWPPAPGRG